MVWARRGGNCKLICPRVLADHHIAEQLPQRARFFWQARVAARHELLAKLLGLLSCPA